MTSAVTEEAAELAQALTIARHCIRQPDQDTPAMITGSHGGTGSKPPWNPTAAAAYFDATAAIRTLEAELTITVTGHPPRPRGGSHTNTIQAITMITRLTTSEHDARRLQHIRTPCDQLPARDTQERPIPIRLERTCPQCGIPRQQAGNELVCHICGSKATAPLCPYCHTPQLRLFQRSGRVVCCHPHCTDHDGQRPAASLTRNQLDGTPMLIGDDGTPW